MLCNAPTFVCLFVNLDMNVYIFWLNQIRNPEKKKQIKVIEAVLYANQSCIRYFIIQKVVDTKKRKDWKKDSPDDNKKNWIFLFNSFLFFFSLFILHSIIHSFIHKQNDDIKFFILVFLLLLMFFFSSWSYALIDVGVAGI